MWKGKKSQAAALESVLLGGGKGVLQRHVMRQLREIWVMIPYRAAVIS